MRPTPRTDAIYKPTKDSFARVPMNKSYDYARTLERELAEAVELLRVCVTAASKDIVEDFSHVSNAADAALTFLKRMEGK